MRVSAAALPAWSAWQCVSTTCLISSTRRPSSWTAVPSASAEPGQPGVDEGDLALLEQDERVHPPPRDDVDAINDPPRTGALVASLRRPPGPAPRVRASPAPADQNALGDHPSARSRRLGARGGRVQRPETVSWFSAWRIRCSICQRSASDSPRSTPRARPAPPRVARARARRRSRWRRRRRRRARSRGRAHLEEPGPRRELEHVAPRPGWTRVEPAFSVATAAHAARGRRSRRLPGHDQHLGLALEAGPVGRDKRDVEGERFARPPASLTMPFAALRRWLVCGLSLGGGEANYSPPPTAALLDRPSIGPTM